MADPLTRDVSDRICAHMNEDHADAVVLYAKVYGGAKDAIAAQMVTIDPQGMDLLVVQPEEQTRPIRVEFDHPLNDSEDAHHTLIEMVKQARTHMKANP